MKTTFKRATALLLSLLMVFSVCSTALVVYAASAREVVLKDGELVSAYYELTLGENNDFYYIAPVGGNMEVKVNQVTVNYPEGHELAGWQSGTKKFADLGFKFYVNGEQVLGAARTTTIAVNPGEKVEFSVYCPADAEFTKARVFFKIQIGAGDVKYVSIGDSMTNGYGLEGYEEPDGNGNITNWFGFKRNNVEGSYPYKVAKHFGWQLNQIATSGLRADDVYYLLNLGTDNEVNWDEYGDRYMAEKFEQSYKDAHNGANGTKEEIIAWAAKEYQAAIKEADVISIGIGSNNFATLMDMRMMWWMGRILGNTALFGGYNGAFDFNELVADLTADQKAQIAEVYDDIYAEIEEIMLDSAAKLGISMDAVLTVDGATFGDFAKDFTNAIAYTTAGFALGYKGIVDTIIRENDNAEIIIVGLTNWFRGMVYGIPVGEKMLELPLGDMMETVCDFAGVYMAALPATYAVVNGDEAYTVYFADTNAEDVEDVELIVDEIVKNTAQVDLSVLDAYELGSDERFEAAKAIAQNITSAAIPSGTVRDRLLEAMGGFVISTMGMTVPTMVEIEAFEAAVAEYNALDDTAKEPYGPAGALAYASTKGVTNFEGIIAYLGLEKSMISSLHLDVVNVEHFKVLSSLDKLMETTGKALDGHMTGIDDIAGALIAVPELGTVSNLMFNFLVGSGVIVHPSDDGHTTIANVIIDAYEDEYTVVDETIKNAMAVLALLAEYYDEAYAYAYDYAENYIAAAVGAIENAKVAVNNIAIPFPTGTTEAFVAHAYVLKAEILETLTQAQTFILEADELDQATLDEFLALLNEAAEDLNAMAALLNQAAADVNTLAIIPAINAAHNELVNNVIPTVKSMLEQAVIEGTKKFVELAKTALGDLADAAVKAAIKFAPELDAMLYDYFYNNPEEVIAFFAEYGYIIAELAEKYGDEALGVAAYVLVVYGEDIAKFFMENYETIFEGIVAWADKYGERTIEMIQVYAEATGLCDAVRAEIAALEEKLADLKAQLDYQLKVLEEELGVQLEVLKAQLESLKRELLIAAEPYKQAILAEIAKVEALIAEIEAKIEQIKALIAEIEAKIIEIQNQIAELNARLQNLIYAINNLDEALKYLAYAGLEAATPMIQQALNGVAYAVSQLVGFVSEEAAKALDALIEQAKAFLDEAFYNATHADYAIDNTSSHVALGDNTMTAQLFGQYVQSIVNGSDVYYTYKTTDLTSAGSKISALPVVLAENLETIAAADLITIGYGYDALAEETVNLLFDLILLGTAKVDYNIDLVAKVGPEAAAEIDKIVANVYANLIQNNLGITLNKGGIPVADAVVIAMKYFAYYAAEYAVYMPQAVYAIHEINPEALIMINAISNPIAGASIAVALPEMGLDVEIAFGDYLNYVCDAIYLETAVLAAINEKVVFVPATGIETTFTNKTVSFNGLADLVDLLMNYETVMAEMFNIETTVNGNVAVVNKMADALNITVEHSALLGDVNGDGVVSITDAVLVLRFDAQLPDVVIDLSVADVDGDGMINITDAVWILRYDALLVDKLPASK